MKQEIKEQIIFVRLLKVEGILRTLGVPTTDIWEAIIEYRNNVRRLITDDDAFSIWVHEAFGSVLGDLLLTKERSTMEMMRLINDSKVKGTKILKERGLKIEVI